MNNNISIMERDLEYAQTLCASISDVEKRNRAVANAIAVKIASMSFDSNTHEIDAESGLYKINSIAEKYDLSDIYINGSYVDVRVYFSEDELGVPKSHFEKSILPSAYMFVKLSPDLQKGVITGFIRPVEIDQEQVSNDEYFYLSEDSLTTFDAIEARFRFSPEESDIDEAKIYDYIDNSMNELQEDSFIKDLLISRKLREKLAKALRAQSLFGMISLPQKEALTFINNENEYVEVDETDKETADSDSEFDGFFEQENEELTSSDEQEDIPEEYDTDIVDEELMDALDYSTEVTPSGAEVIASLDNEPIEDNNEEFAEDNEYADSEQIDTLFTGEQEGIPINKKSKAKTFLILMAILALAGYGAWKLYSNYVNGSPEENTLSQEMLPDVNQTEPVQKIEKQEAMPIETVENTKPSVSKEAPEPISIPAIEKNLDASVLVSNLKVYWEVPSGYVSNTSAQRYLVKLGKIVQLNLKTELLLLSKPPLVNKIAVELKYNPNTGKFDVVGLKNSSGEKTVDEAILTTVKKALSLNINANTISFSKLQGNPVLVINL